MIIGDITVKNHMESLAHAECNQANCGLCDAFGGVIFCGIGDYTLQYKGFVQISTVRVIVITAAIIQIAMLDLAGIGCNPIKLVPESVQFAKSLLHRLCKRSRSVKSFHV